MLLSLAPTDSGWRALVIPTNPTEFWTAGLVVVALFGLLSVWLLKKDIRNRTTREAVQTTIDRCEEMAMELIPAFLEILKEMAAQKVKIFLSDPAKVSFSATDEARNVNAAIVWLGSVPEPTRNKAIALMNRLEVWCMSFTHNPALANQKVAFKPCSAAFCQIVMWLYPMLLTQRRLGTPNDESGPYQNVVTMYKAWSGEQAKGKLNQLLEHLVRLEAGESLPKPIS